MPVSEWRGATVRAVRPLTADIRLIEIAPDGAFAAPAPGAHLKVGVTIVGRPDTRSYSVVGPCEDGVYRIAVKRLKDSRGGSAYMTALAPGARLTIAGPDQNFSLAPGRPQYCLIAGGIGVTPIYSHALALQRAGADFHVLYGAHRREDFALADALREHIGERLQTFVGEDGRRIDLAAEFAKLTPGGEAYVCGPLGMLEAAKRAWRASGRPADCLRFETFGASGSRPTAPFEIRLPKLNRTIPVPASKSMLEALEEAGVEMIFDCRKGECGLCALKILNVDGEVDHRDVFFSDEEKSANARICTCVSRVFGTSITLETADR
jgi:ferredoxin-NADP reductase